MFLPSRKDRSGPKPILLQLYAAFDRGDFNFILAGLTDDVSDLGLV
jgi:hypothetical protein